MSVKKMTQVWESSSRKGGSLLLLLAIADFAVDDGFAWPALPTLAHKIRMSGRHTLRMVGELVDIGELFVHPRPGHNNQYIVLVGTSQESFYRVCQTRIKMGTDEAIRAWQGCQNVGANPRQNVTPTPDKMSPHPRQNVTLPPTKCHVTPDIAMSPDPSLTINNPINDPSSDMALPFSDSDWKSVKEQLRGNMTQATFDANLRDAQVATIDGGVLVLNTLNQSRADWINAQLKTVIARAVKDQTGHSYEIWARCRPLRGA